MRAVVVRGGLVASVTVLIKGTVEQQARAAGDRRMRMFTREAGLLRLPLVPVARSRAGIEDVWEQIPRPGRKPIMYRTGKNLETLSFAAELYDNGRSVKPYQKLLEDLCASEDPVVVTLSAEQMGVFRITGCAFTDTEENAAGKPTRSTADIELTEDSDASPVVGPVPRGGGKGFAT
jgi:phage protein U